MRPFPARLGRIEPVLRAILMQAGVAVGTLLAVPLLLTLAGYRVNGGSTDVAREAAETRGEP